MGVTRLLGAGLVTGMAVLGGVVLLQATSAGDVGTALQTSLPDFPLYTQQYHPGTPALVSTPPLLNSSDHVVQLLKVTPIYHATCPVVFTGTVAFQSSGQDGYIASSDTGLGPYDEVDPMKVQQVRLRQHWGGQWVTFLFHSRCGVTFTGYRVQYRSQGANYTEDLPAKTIFIANRHFQP